MRKVVVIEGTTLPDGRMVAPGACWVDVEDEHIPITTHYGYRDPDTLLGKASDMQRDETTGEISFEIESFEHDLEPWDFTFIAQPFELHADDRNVITKARIRGLMMKPLEPGFPKDVIKMIDDANATEDSDVENPDQPKAPSEFVRELESLLNRHSMENGSDTPDFILAEFLGDVLTAWNEAMVKREKWYDREIGGWQNEKVENN